jgi:hypothetical protein
MATAAVLTDVVRMLTDPAREPTPDQVVLALAAIPKSHLTVGFNPGILFALREKIYAHIDAYMDSFQATSVEEKRIHHTLPLQLRAVIADICKVYKEMANREGAKLFDEV